MSEIAATTAPLEKPAPAARPAPVRPGRMRDDRPPDIPAEALTFDDLLDFINPLQHLPIIGSLYREFTGDQIKPAMQVAGGLLFGGPTGLMGSVFQVLFEQVAGDDVLGSGMAMIGLKEPEGGGTAIASADAAPAQVTAEVPAPEISRNAAARVEAAGDTVVLSEAQDAYLRALAAQTGGTP